MITLQEICHYLKDLLQIDLFDDYCINGLQLEGKKSIQKMATGVTASLDTIQKACQLRVDLLLVHHGLFWNRDPQCVIGSKKEKLAYLLKHDISLLAYHLPLDAHPEFGNNFRAAKEMGWENLQSFAKYGVKGNLKKALEPTDLQRELENYYDHKAQTVIIPNKPIKSIALVSGGAYKCVLDAAQEGIDAFVTGNVDEPVWHMAKEEGINFFSLGHSATEKIGVKTLGDHLAQKFGLESQFIDDENPF